MYSRSFAIELDRTETQLKRRRGAGLEPDVKARVEQSRRSLEASMTTVSPLVAASVFTGGSALIHLLRAHPVHVTKGLVAILLLVATLGFVAATKPASRNAWHLTYEWPF